MNALMEGRIIAIGLITLAIISIICIKAIWNHLTVIPDTGIYPTNSMKWLKHIERTCKHEH